MMAQMSLDKRRNEVVTVVVAVMQSELQRQAALCAGGLEQSRLKLFFQIRIGTTLVDQDLAVRRTIAHISSHFAGIVFLPACGIFTQIIAKRLLSPWAVQRRAYRREGRQ